LFFKINQKNEKYQGEKYGIHANYELVCKRWCVVWRMDENRRMDKKFFQSHIISEFNPFGLYTPTIQNDNNNNNNAN